MLILTQWGMVFHVVAVYGFDSEIFFPATFYDAMMMGQTTNVL